MVHQASAMVSKEWLVQKTQSSIDDLITSFKSTPYFFYTENDLHCYLHNRIFSSLPREEWQCITSDEKTSILLHKEYPTKARYDAKTPREVNSGGARGHFDLCIWNPERARERVFRAEHSDFENEQHTFIAIEFDLIERNRTFETALHHFKWDLLKLTGSKNEVEHGYQLVFVRDWIHKGDFVSQTRKEAAKAKNTIVLFIERDKDSASIGTLSPKPFLNYSPVFK
jgi:hypothetical protein